MQLKLNPPSKVEGACRKQVMILREEMAILKQKNDYVSIGTS